MVMEFVSKLNLEHVRFVSKEDSALLGKAYSQNMLDSESNALLQSIRDEGLFLVCDCLPKQKVSPMLGTRLINDNLHLVNLRGRSKHSKDCLFAYSPKDNERPPAVVVNESLVSQADNSRLDIDPSTLAMIYPSIVKSSELNIFDSTAPIADFEQRVIDGARLTRLLAKNGAGSKIRFGINSYSKISEELAEAEEKDYRIQLSVITGFDQRSIFTMGSTKKKFMVDAGEVHYQGATSQGPFVATTFYSKKGGYVFPIRTSIIPCYSYKLPIPVFSDEDREIIGSLIDEKGLFDWIEKKSDLGRPSISIPMLPEESHVTVSMIHPRIVIKLGDVSCVIASPLKADKGAYQEDGVLLWHRSLSCYPAKRKTELSDLKRKITGILMNKK